MCASFHYGITLGVYLSYMLCFSQWFLCLKHFAGSVAIYRLFTLWNWLCCCFINCLQDIVIQNYLAVCNISFFIIICVFWFHFLSNFLLAASYCRCGFDFSSNEKYVYFVTVWFLKGTADVFWNMLDGKMLILLHYFSILGTTSFHIGKLQVLLFHQKDS
jgi:hypothetical protein